MKLSELIAAVQKATQLVGDGEVVLSDVEQGVVHGLQALQVTIPGESSPDAPTVTLVHGPVPAAAPAAPPTPDAAAGGGAP